MRKSAERYDQFGYPGVRVQWKWAAAVYTNFSSDYEAVGVKPVDDNAGRNLLRRQSKSLCHCQHADRRGRFGD